MRYVIVLFFCVLCYGQNVPDQANSDSYTFSERIGNFSLELLHYIAKDVGQQNFILSPITTWTVLTLISEGATDETLSQLKYALRLPQKEVTRNGFQDLVRSIQLKTDAVELTSLENVFINKDNLPERDFLELAKRYYGTEAKVFDFKDAEKSVKAINDEISRFTHGRIPTIVESGDLADAMLILTSAVYFKGSWANPFNVTDTSRRPFYDSYGNNIGQVNMMYNRYKYPFTMIKELQARILELPYGKDGKLSMLIMMPNSGVSLDSMFLNFKKVPLDKVFKELVEARDVYGDEEVECYIPRFKIETSLDLIESLKKFDIVDLFDSRARLPMIARMPIYVKMVKHKAEIEVTEEGTIASGVTTAGIVNYSGVPVFEANRPFTYLIIEKTTNTILFGGIYQQPSLF